jgi:glutathione S-transferase
MKPLKLFDFGPTRCIRVRWTLQELGVAYEVVTIDLFAGEHRHPEFLKINPAGKLPVLVDGDMVLTESIAIVLYLAEKYPEKALIPTDIRQRAELNRWLLFTTTELEQPLWRIRRHTAVYPRDKRLPGEVTLASDEFGAMAKVLEEHMRGRTFVVGESVTVGDFVLAYTLDWAKTAGLLNELSELEAYLERMYARPHAPMRLAQALALVGAGRKTGLPSDTAACHPAGR